MAGLRAKVVLSVDTAQAKRSTERAAAEMNRVMGGVGKRQVNFNVNSKSFTQPLGRITGSANEFTKSLEASNARVIAFGASVGIINAISDAFKNLVGETVRFQKTLTDINVVLNQSNSAMQQFGQGLFDVARNTAQSFNVASEAALEFSRQGLTMEEVLKRTNDALTLTRLTGLKAAEAVSGLTAAVNAFSSVGLTTTQVIDKLAAVDVKFAVSSEDLINALERTGAVAIDAGVELDSLIGLVTSLQQTTARGGAVIGNGLKTIFTRIQRPAALSQIEDLDIAVRNMSGAILPADKILINIAKSFDRLTSSQQSNIVQFSAGIFQANVFRASLRDLAKDQSIQARATEVSASAAGEAAMKNKQLNKTISALASQTGSDIQELASLLGELMVKPELGSYLETFRDVIGGIKNMLGGGEDEGNTFAKGLVAGIGNIITGPAFIAFGAIFIKLFMNIAKFAKGSMKDVMNIVDRKTKVEQIEKSIVDTLAKNKDIQTSLNNLEGDREAQSKFILKVIEAQTNAMREQEKLASRLARPLLDAGVKSDLTVSGNGRVDLDGDGRTDSFGAGGVVPQSARKERKEASRGGYSAGAVDSMSIKGLGRVVYNKAETVKQFPGMQQPAIMPPQGSRAGGRYQDAFAEKHGFNPYASGGFIPNFATLNGDALRLNQSKMHLYANPREAKPGGDAVRNAMMELVNSGKPVTVRAATDKLLKGEGGSHTKAIKGLIRYIADQKNGPKLFERDFKLTNLPWKGNKGEDASEDAVAQALNKGGNKYINTGKRPGAHGDKTFPVDLIGEGLDPVEVKSGEWQQPNILLKSMRLYSDDELMQFAERQYGATPEMLTGARMENLGKSARLLQGKGLLDKDASLEEQHEAALKYGVGGGFVPSFAGGWGGGRANAGRLPKWEEALAKIESWAAIPGNGAPDKATILRETGVKWPKMRGVLRGKENDSTFVAAKKQLGGDKLKILQDFISDASDAAPQGKNMTAADIGIWASSVKLEDAVPASSTPSLSGADISKAFPGVITGQVDAFAGLTPPLALTGKDLKNFNRATFRGQIDEKGLGKNKKGATAEVQKLLSNTGIIPGWKDWEDLLMLKGYKGMSSNPLTPLDFTIPPAEAKWGAHKDKLKPEQIIGKLLRHQVGSGNFPGWDSKTSSAFKSPAQGAFNIGSLDLLSVPKAAQGLVPNFADDRNRQQKISDVLGDPSNAGINFKGGALKPRSIKSKNMFQKTWLESYFKTGLEGDYQMLMKMGYDPDQLLDLRAYSKKGGDVNVLGKGLVPNFAAGFGGALAGASKTAVQFGLAKMPRKNDLFMGAANVPSKIAKVSSKKGELHTEEGQAVRLDQLVHQEYSNRIPGASNNLFSRTSSNPVGMFNTLNKSKKAMIRDGYLEAGLLKHSEGNGFRLQKMDGKWHYESMGSPTQADNRLMNDMEMMSGQTFKYGLSQAAPQSGGFIDWDSRRPGYLAEGLIPNFADTTLYRGTSPKYQKGSPDRPNAPQFLFDKLLNAKTKAEFMTAVEELGIQHSQGQYSGSYNADLKPATLEQIRGPNVLGAGEVQHAGYVYKRPTKGGRPRYASDGTTMPSGFVSKTKDHDVADRFSRAIEFQHTSNHNLQGQIHEDQVPNSRILNEEALGKIVDRVGLGRVQKGFKRMMKKGTLKALYLDLDKWKPKTEEGERRRSYDDDHNYRSIGQSGEGMTFNEQEVVQIWDKHSPYYGGAGVIPNFANPLKDAVSRERQAGIPESKIRVEKSKQLRGPGNPMGLAVTNTRDEPLGVGQGIRRARSMGIDPRKHGAASGVVPNFAAPDELELPDEVFNALIEDAEKLEKAMGEELTSAVGEATEALKTMGNTGVTPSENRKATEQAINDQSAKLKAEKGKDPADQNKEAIKDGESIIEHLKGILGAIKEKEGAVGETAKVKNAGQKITKSDANIEQIDAVINRIINKKIKEVGGATDGKERKALVKTTEELQNFKKTLEESEESIKDEKQERGEGLQKLFYMQSAISMTNGFLEQFAEGARGGTAALIGVAQAASNVTAAYIQQKELIGEGMNMLGVGEKEKGFSLVGGDSWAEQRAKGAATELKIRGKAEAGGKKGGMLGGLIGNAGKLGRTFGRFLPILGQLYTGFTMANEAVKFLTQTFPDFGKVLGLEKGEGIMDLFSSSATKAAKKLERLGKTVESLETVLGHLENKEEEQIKLRELEVTGANRTQAQEKEYYDLRVKSIDTDAALAASMSSMMDETKSGSGALARINAVIGSTTMSMAEQRVGIRELIVANKMLIAATSQREGFQHGLDRASDGANDSDTAIKLGEARGAQLALTLGTAFEGKADATDNEKVAALEHNIRELTKIRGNYKGIDRANFKTQDAIGSVGLQGMLSDQVVDIEDFESDMTWGLSDTEKKIFKAEVQTLIDGLKKRVKTQKSGLKDDVDMNILSRKRLKLALFSIEQEKKRAKHTSGINLENTLHATKSQGVENDILKEYKGISQSLQIRNKLILDGLDLESKYQHDREEAERGAIDAIDKATQEKLTDPGSLMGPLNTSVGTHTKGEVQDALTEFDKRVGAPITDVQFAKAGETTTGITNEEKEAIRKSFVAAAREVKGMGDAYRKLQVLAEEGNELETARLKAIYVSLISAKEIIKQEDAEAQKNREINEANKLKLHGIENQNELAKKDLAQASVGSLIAAKTVDGAKALHKKLIGTKDAQAISEQLAGVINVELRGEADTLAVINKYNEGMAEILLKSKALNEKAYQSQVEKNRTEMQSGLLALKQLQHQDSILGTLLESRAIQETKLKTEGVNASLAAKEAEARYKFLTKESHRGKLVDAQIKSEMFGLRTDAMLNRDKLKRKIIGGQLKEQAELELKEQTTATSSEALKTAQLAVNLNHLRRAGSLSDDANRLLEKSNKLIEAQNAARQASMSRGDLAFNTRANLNTEQAGAIGETRGAAMRSIMTNSPEDALAFASSLEETNKQINNGTRAVDRLRTRMTELDVSAKNLGADLVELGFDGVRSGFKQLLNDIGSGAKSAGDAWRDFGLGLAKTLLDRLTDHNIDRIVKDLTFAFTGVEVKSEAEKIASSNSHLMDHLSSLTTSNDSLKDGILSLERQLREGIKLRPEPKDESAPPVIPDKTPTRKLSYWSGMGPSMPGAPVTGTPGATLPTQPGATTQGAIDAGKKASRRGSARVGLGARRPVHGPTSTGSKHFERVLSSSNLPPLIAEEQAELERKLQEAKTDADKAVEIEKKFRFVRKPGSAIVDQSNYNLGEESPGGQAPALEVKGEFLQRQGEQKAQLKQAKRRDAALLEQEEEAAKRLNKLVDMTPEEFAKDAKKNHEGVKREQQILEGLRSKRKAEDSAITALTKSTESFTERQREAEHALGKTSEALSTVTDDLRAFYRARNLESANRSGPATLPKQGGGRIQHFADGGFVKGPGGKDKVPAMLTAGEFVVPKKEADNIQKFNGGTPGEGAEEKPKGRTQRGVEGGLQAWAMIETVQAMNKAINKDVDKPPTFNMKKLDSLDLGSDVNLKRGDPRLSAKFLAKDPVMQEYRDYLIDAANYKTQKTNEEFREDMGVFSSIFSAVTSFVTAELVAIAAPYVQKAVSKTTDYFKGDLGLGKHSGAYQDLKDRGFDPSYSDVSESLESGKDLVLHRNKGKSNESEYSFKPYSGKFRDDKSNENNTEFEFMPHRSQIHGRQRRAPTRPGAAAFEQSRGLATIKTKKSQGGGSIPAMLTAGEGYIPAPVAKRIGYNNLSHMNNTGSMPIVKGTGGVDNVGPVGLNSGDFIMKKSSTNKLLRDNPNAMRFSLQGQSDGRKGAQGYYEGGVVGSELTVPARSLGPQKSQQGNRLGLLDQKESEKSDSSTAGSTTNAETTNNININISIDKAGAEVESEEGGEESYEKERNLSMKIKGAVLEVIREEKRIGGELS